MDWHQAAGKSPWRIAVRRDHQRRASYTVNVSADGDSVAWIFPDNGAPRKLDPHQIYGFNDWLPATAGDVKLISEKRGSQQGGMVYHQIWLDEAAKVDPKFWNQYSDPKTEGKGDYHSDPIEDISQAIHSIKGTCPHSEAEYYYCIGDWVKVCKKCGAFLSDPGIGHLP